MPITKAMRPYFLLVLVASVSIVLAYAFFLSGPQGLHFDAGYYYQLGEQIAKEGLFSFHDATRPYGFPLFIAIIWSFSDHSPSSVQFFIFSAQLLILLGTCLYAFAVFQRSFQSSKLAACLFAVLALNPFLLIFTGQVLSDLLSAVFIFAALLLAVQAAPSNANRLANRDPLQSTREVEMLSFLSFLVAGWAVIVRPANLPIGLAVAFVWFMRRRLFREGSVRSYLLMVLGFAIPFVPQLINNYRTYAQFQPLIVRSLYGQQLDWGAKYLRYASVVSPGYTGGVAFLNPFLSHADSSFSEFFSNQPFEFFLTQGIHLFALFDYDSAFPYITDPGAWYRLPLGIANDVFLLGAILGILFWIVRLARSSSFDHLDLTLTGMLAGILLYLPGYVLTAVEARFSLPVYLLLGPFFVFALWQTQIALIRKHWSTTLAESLGLFVFLAANLWLSHWLQSQVQFWDRTGTVPYPLNQSTMNAMQVRFGDRVQLVEYAINRTNQIQGGDILYLAVNWTWQQDTTTPLNAQIDLVDSQNHIWSQIIPNLASRAFPFIGSLWGPSQVRDLVTLPLPVTMPSGEYSIVTSLHDSTTGQPIPTYRATGELLGDSIRMVTLAIAKNRASFTADQLYIENPFFVDMREMRLLGYKPLPDQVGPGTDLDVGLYWRARDKPHGDYVVVVQLRDALGNVALEQSVRPAQGNYPTKEWNAGEVLLDWHRLAIPESIPQAEYFVFVMLRDVEQSQILGETNIGKITIIQ